MKESLAINRSAKAIEIARSYKGTPFRHLGRVPGQALDCAGVLVCVAHELNVTDYDFTGYAKQPHSGIMAEVLSKHMDEVDIIDAMPGDWLHICYDTTPQHLALLTDKNTIIHAIRSKKRGTRTVGGVVEQTLPKDWKKTRVVFNGAHVAGAYSFKNG